MSGSERRRAAVSKGLVVALVVVAVAAVVFWGVRMRGSGTASAGEVVATLFCPTCGEVPVTKKQYSTLKRSAGKVECPKCGKIEGSWDKPTGDEKAVIP